MTFSISWLLCLNILFLSLSLIKSDRDIQIFRNNCTEKAGMNVYYVKATSKSDVLHYIYSGGNFTETLSVIIIKTDLHSSVKIICDNLINGDRKHVFQVSDANYRAYGFVLTKIYEYDDLNDKVDMNSKNWIVRGFDEFIWNVNSSVPNSIIFTSNNTRNNSDELLSGGGTIQIRFNISGHEGYAQGMPCLKFTSNNTQVDVILNSLKTTFKQSRFAVEIALINNYTNDYMKIKEDKTVDDEHSPGVFRIENLYSPSTNNLGPFDSTYLQWKPVCYLAATDHSLNKLSSATHFHPGNISNSASNIPILNASLALVFFGNSILESNTTISFTNVTFGISGDKFFNQSHYVIWTLSFGLGQPPTESISATVILIISFGLGLPFVLVVVGSIYLIIKKRMNRRLSYETIEDPIN